MKNIFILIFLLIFSSCNKNNNIPQKIQSTAQSHNVTANRVILYCGQIQYGCEDVDTDTLTIEILSKDKINVIRQFHHSDLPITSAFVGKFINNKEISATYNRDLTEKSWRQVQDEFPQGEVLLTLSCSDLKTYQGCKVSGKAIDSDAMGKYPGWEAKDNAPDNLLCNLKEFQSTQASEKDCQQSE